MSFEEIEEGIRPVKLLCWRLTYWSEGIDRMLDGRFPLSSFEWRLRILRESSFPRLLLFGMVPFNPIPGRWMLMTLVSFWLQVMPIHEVQTGVELFQFNLKACGRVKENSRREFLSEIKSARVKLKRDDMMLRKSNGTMKNWNLIDDACLVINVLWL